MSQSLESNTLTLHRYRRTNKSYAEDLGDGVKLTLMLIDRKSTRLNSSHVD